MVNRTDNISIDSRYIIQTISIIMKMHKKIR